MDADANLAAGFSRARFLVLDEADRLLDPTFEGALRTVLGALPPSSQRQTLLFSATMTKSLVKLQRAMLADAFVFQVRAGRACRAGWVVRGLLHTWHTPLRPAISPLCASPKYTLPPSPRTASRERGLPAPHCCLQSTEPLTP